MKHQMMNRTWMGAIALALPMLAGCGQLSNYKSRTAVLESISDAEWAAAAANPVTISFVAYNAKFSPENTVFETGKPYVLKVKNPPSSSNISSGAEHYLADYNTDQGINADILNTSDTPLLGGTRWSSNGFWSSIVINKIVTRQAEYKVPFMLDFEINKTANNGGYGSNGSSVSTTVTDHGTNFALIYFVPLRSGSYKVWCSKGRTADGTGSHSAMTGTIQIVGSPDFQPDFELADDFDMALARSARRDSGHGTTTTSGAWKNGSSTANHAKGMLSVGGSGSLTVASSMFQTDGSTSLGAFTMPTAIGGVNKGYQLRFHKSSGASDSYKLESDLFKNVVIRKIQDIDVQLKPVYVESVTLLGGVGDSTCATTANCAADTDTDGSTAVAGGYNGTGNPGKRQVDFWIVPDAGKKGSYPLNFTNVSSGATATETMVVN